MSIKNKKIIAILILISSYSQFSIAEIPDSIAFIQYKTMLKNVISKSWFKSDEFEKGWICKVTVKQNKKGFIYSKEEPLCNTENNDFIDSVNEAVITIYKLPVARSSFYSEEITLTFYQN